VKSCGLVGGYQVFGSNALPTNLHHRNPEEHNPHLHLSETFASLLFDVDEDGRVH
jgi:hypothetical protein